MLIKFDKHMKNQRRNLNGGICRHQIKKADFQWKPAASNFIFMEEKLALALPRDQAFFNDAHEHFNTKSDDADNHDTNNHNVGKLEL